MPPIIFEVLARVPAENLLAFDNLTEEMNAAASDIGRARSIGVATVDGEQPGVRARRISVTFASDADLAGWLASPEHARFVARLESLLVDRYQTQVRTGMESWVPTPGVRPPKRWKSAIATFLGLFPLLILLSFVADALRFDALGPIGALALSVAISCVVMTWIVMPLLTRKLRGWLND